MSEYLPYGEFEFLENFNIQQILYTSNTSQIGYILECDLDYPKIKKLLLTLFPKKNYIIHYRNLKMYLDLGMKLTKVHKVLKFKQSPWLKQYIDLNNKY
jgi:hypothetical protein